MRVVQPEGTKAAALQIPAHVGGGRAAVSRSRRLRRSEQQTKNTRVAVIFSLFLVLLAAALLIGGRAVIDPLLRAAADRRETHRIGDIVFTMRDSTLCRHLSFDNKTAELLEGAVAQCDSDQLRGRAAAINGFSWGAR
jgi:hypothetical protein